METKVTLPPPPQVEPRSENRVETTRQIGVSLPPLPVEDLPTPEEAFRVKRLGLEEVILFVLGPSLIALGASIGSGEWMLGPVAISRYGFQGVGWVILISAVLQVFYNVELARYTLATGEPPVVAFGRIPPGPILWIPLAILSFYMAFILGGWTVSAGSSLFTLFTGRPYLPAESELVNLLGILLLFTIFPLVLYGRKIARTLEAVHGIMIVFILISLIMVTLTVVPLDFWARSLGSLVAIAPPPPGAALSNLGALAGFTALASGLNFMFIGFYRDKGYAMAHRSASLAGVTAQSVPPLPSHGRTFPENELNAARWKRWFRYLLLDQWGVYFTGALIGMLVPSILVAYLVSLPGAEKPNETSIILYAAQQLGQNYSAVLFGWALIVGFLILFSTQLAILEMMARNLTDALFGVSAPFRRLTQGDPRKFYLATLLGLILAISLIIHLAKPSELISISANLTNFAALIFPLAMIYLNRQLPRPARIRWWSYLVLLANSLFFGFFFINFLITTLRPVLGNQP